MHNYRCNFAFSSRSIRGMTSDKESKGGATPGETVPKSDAKEGLEKRMTESLTHREPQDRVSDEGCVAR